MIYFSIIGILCLNGMGEIWLKALCKYYDLNGKDSYFKVLNSFTGKEYVLTFLIGMICFDVFLLLLLVGICLNIIFLCISGIGGCISNSNFWKGHPLE